MMASTRKQTGIATKAPPDNGSPNNFTRQVRTLLLIHGGRFFLAKGAV